MRLFFVWSLYSLIAGISLFFRLFGACVLCCTLVTENLEQHTSPLLTELVSNNVTHYFSWISLDMFVSKDVANKGCRHNEFKIVRHE